MRKLIYLLPLILFLGCTKDVIEPIVYVQPKVDIFEVQNTVVNDADEIVINFDSDGTYRLSLIDEFTNITYTNEKYNATEGSNSLNIYTKALPKGSYNFLIKDNQNNIIKQTKIKL